MSKLPTFEEIRRNTHRMLGDAADELRSDWSDEQITKAQADAKAEAMKHIGLAKAALDRAARR